MVDIKANLRRALKARRFSARAAAIAGGVPESTFRAWLKGNVEEIGAIKLLKVLYALQISVDELFGEIPKDGGSPAGIVTIRTPPDLAGETKGEGKPAGTAN